MSRHDDDGGLAGGGRDGPGQAVTVEAQAAEIFIQRRYGAWTSEDQAALERRVARDPAFARACERVEASWTALGEHAEAPEVIAHRAEAISVLRRGGFRRWMGRAAGPWRRGAMAAAAASMLLAMAGLAGYLWLPGERPGEYRTGVGERRVVELEDRSRIVLDASTALRVDYSAGAREVRIEEGQAQFTVAKDPMRPFKVQAGDHTVVALGTVFTVEYFDRAMHVAMMEGRVAVVPRQSADSRAVPVADGRTAREGSPARGAIIELSAGEDLRVDRDGRPRVDAEADLESATAWLQGRIIFRDESLGAAVRRFNRYSHMRIEIEDEALAARRISGVFESGDTPGFVSAVERYLPARADRADSRRVLLRPR